jgi:pyruvate kinase
MDFKTLCRKHQVKIIATVGPSSDKPEIIAQLIREGASLFRINLSHSSKEDVKRLSGVIREGSRLAGVTVGVIADIPGPKLRISGLDHEIHIKAGEQLCLVHEGCSSSDYPVDHAISLNYPDILEDVNVTEHLLIDDGTIRLRAIDKESYYILFEALNDGVIKPNKGVHLPRTHLRIGFPTEEDLAWVGFLCDHNLCDYMALSYIRAVGDIERVKEIIRERQKNIHLIAKIEKQEAVVHLKEIAKAAYGVMVARGDLGIELPIEDIPHIQKKIIHLCNQMGTPVITATQMLESMIESPTPTRAEAADIANAVLDGSDAVMLSAETAVSRNPALVVKTMRKIIEKTESHVDYQKLIEERSLFVQNDISDSIANSASRIAKTIDAACIVCLTSSGSTARRISKYRPQVPIFSLTDKEYVISICELMWGVIPLYLPLSDNVQESIDRSVGFLKEKGKIKKGDRVVFTLGIPMGVSGSTNLIQVLIID